MICETAQKTHISAYQSAPEGLHMVSGALVQIVRTSQRLGGSRAWFVCPSCNRRCAILYPQRCRICEGLRYRSEHLSPRDRASLQARRKRQRLGQHGGNLSSPIPAKPKRMRWHTYFAKRAEIRRADALHLSHMRLALDRIRGA